LTHTRIFFLWGEDPDKGGYDANILKAGVALRAARATFACRRGSRAGIHDACATSKPKARGYGDVGIKQAIAEGTIPGPRLFCVDAWDFFHWRIQPRRLCTGIADAEGSTDY